MQRLDQAIQFYALLLRLYPADHYEAFHTLMIDSFKDAYRDTLQTEGKIGPGFWLDVICDELRSVIRERVVQVKGGLDMKSYRYSLGLGLLMMVSIVWSTVISPTFESDDEYGIGPYILLAVLLLLFFAFCGYLASRKTNRIADGTRVGLVTALIIIGMVTVTFFLVDNVFIDIVSKQPDKIYGFAHSGYATMRDYINSGFFRGIFTVIPIFGVVGAVCGAIGGYLHRLLSHSPLMSHNS